MKSEDKPKGEAAREGARRRALERLKPEEAAAVLRHPLEIHPRSFERRRGDGAIAHAPSEARGHRGGD
jgi:hypothetical protein